MTKYINFINQNKILTEAFDIVSHFWSHWKTSEYKVNVIKSLKVIWLTNSRLWKWMFAMEQEPWGTGFLKGSYLVITIDQYLKLNIRGFFNKLRNILYKFQQINKIITSQVFKNTIFVITYNLLCNIPLLFWIKILFFMFIYTYSSFRFGYPNPNMIVRSYSSIYFLLLAKKHPIFMYNRNTKISGSTPF